MTSTGLLSSSERKILLGISLLICFFFYASLVERRIVSYHHAIEQAELEKMEDANDPHREKFTFTWYSCGYSTPLWITIIAVLFMTAPLVYSLLQFGRSFKWYVISFLINSFTFWGFYLQINHSLRYGRDFFGGDVYKMRFYELILTRSTSMEFYLLLSVSALFVLQLFFLMRYVVNRSSSKISLA